MADGGDGQILTFPVGTVEYRPDELAPIKPQSPAAQILSKAAELIDGERNVQHGDRKACHTQIARLWTAYLGCQVTPVDVASMMILLKLARTQTGNQNSDSWVDICGYGAIAGELANVPRP